MNIEFVRTDAEQSGQPWHVRLRADNGEVTWSTENYADRRDAWNAIELLGRTFSPVGLARVHGWGDAAELIVWFDSDELGAKVSIPVRYVDERTAAGV